MKRIECPSCAMEIDAKSSICPICSYEFPKTNTTYRWVAILLVMLFFLILYFKLIAIF